MDDQFDFGSYAPSMANNSRSGSMKKLTRKTDKSPAVDDKKSIKKNNDFDQLDDLLNGDIKQKKKDTSLNKNSSTSQPKKGNDTLDSFFDQPTTNLNITSKIIDKKQTKPSTNMDFARTSINFKPQKKDSFDIIDEDYLPNFSKGTTRQRSKSPTSNQIKIPQDNSLNLQSHTSMRNMRPPMKRKQSQTGLGDKSFNNDTKFGGLSILDQSKQPQTIKASQMLSLNLQDQSEIKVPRNVSRRGSVDNRSQKSQKKFNTGLTLFGDENQKKQTHISHFNIPDRNQTSALRIDSPTAVKARSQISQMKIGQSVMINQKLSSFYNKHQNVSIFKDNQQSKQFSQQNYPSTKNDSSYSFQKPSVKLVEPPRLLNMSTIEQQKKNVFYDYEKQVQHLKQTYQKQMSYLQQSLDKQIKINQQTRERLIRESNNLIEEERKRWTRIHEQQINRLKQMNEWQKKKIQDSYKFQIQNLKSSITQYQSSAHNNTASRYQTTDNSKYKRQIQNLSEQVQLQKKLLMDRQHFLTKRQLQLEQKQQQFNNRKRKQQQYYRDQQKLIMEKENKVRNNMLNEKKSIMDDKQKIAMDAASMELDILKRKEKLDLLIREAEMERQAVENERYQVRNLNQQMMGRYKEKMNQLAEDKERVSNLQADLIRKLRIIELKAKQSNIPINQNTLTHNTKQNNWVKQRPSSAADNSKQQKLNQTFQRYNKIQKITNSNKQSNISFNQKSNKTMAVEQTGQNTFKLDDYLVSLNKNQKSRNNNFM